jgi:hypothetical protein
MRAYGVTHHGCFGHRMERLITLFRVSIETRGDTAATTAICISASFASFNASIGAGGTNSSAS